MVTDVSRMDAGAAAGREKFFVMVARTTAFGTLTSSSVGVRILVEKSPTLITAPSTSPTRTQSPARSVREKVRIKPPAAWPTMPDAPRDTITPTRTLRPLKASLLEPGKYGYAIASAKSQMAAVAMRRVGCTT